MAYDLSLVIKAGIVFKDMIKQWHKLLHILRMMKQLIPHNKARIQCYVNYLPSRIYLLINLLQHSFSYEVADFTQSPNNNSKCRETLSGKCCARYSAGSENRSIFLADFKKLSGSHTAVLSSFWVNRFYEFLFFLKASACYVVAFVYDQDLANS